MVWSRGHGQQKSTAWIPCDNISEAEGYRVWGRAEGGVRKRKENVGTSLRKWREAGNLKGLARSGLGNDMVDKQVVVASQGS